ncbi:MAG: hypothetical protein ACTSRW_17195 [Candidatus Helarchaeota archaeon]
MFPRQTFPSELFTVLGYCVGYVSAIFLFFVLEKHLIKTKFIFTSISIITFTISLSFAIYIITVAFLSPALLGLLIFSPYPPHRIFSYLTLPLLILVIIILYLWIGGRSSDEVRVRALGAAGSITIIFLGMIIDSSAIKNFGIIPLVVAPIMIIIGSILFVYFQRYGGE